MKKLAALRYSCLFGTIFLILTTCSSSDRAAENSSRIGERSRTSQTITDINPAMPLADHLRMLPGVRIIQDSYQVQIRVRGATHIEADSNPLFVVDGTPVGNSYNEVNNVVNMVDVKSIRLVPGPEAIRRFGMRAGTGVIEISTL